MTNLLLPIADLAKYIEEFKALKLEHNREINVEDLGVNVPTPMGTATVRQFIKKEKLPILEITLSNGYTFKAASRHVVQQSSKDAFLEDLEVGDTIDHKNGPVQVTKITKSNDEDCYDFAIDAPHIYYDANGVAHHNTITSATLVKICEGYGRTVTIVPNKSLVEQTEEDFINCALDVGVYYGDRKELNRTHTICTWQSLNALEKKHQEDASAVSLSDFFSNVGTILIDEVHQASADVLQKILTKHCAHAPIRWGFTGTIPKDEISYQRIRTSIGEVVNHVAAHDLQEQGVLSSCNVNIVQTAEWKEFKSYAEELKYLVSNTERMNYVSKLIREISDTGNTLVLVDRIESGRIITSNIPDSVFVSGDVKTKDRKEEYDVIKTSNNRVLVATYGVAAVGLNIPRIFNLVLLEPGKSFVRVIQSIGRGIRKADDKDHVEIYDITASTKYAKRHLSERKQFYREAKYPFSVKKVTYQ